jgi:hypothetical protein
MVLTIGLISILLGAALAFIAYRKDKKSSAPVKWLPAALRGIVGALAVFILLAPLFNGLSKEEEKPQIVLLQDVSSSTQTSLGAFTDKYRQKQEKLIEQLKEKYNVTIYGFGNKLIKDSIYNYTQSGTDIAQALSDVQLQYQDKNVGAVIIASDGIYNQGSHPAFATQSIYPIYSIALGDSTQPKDFKINGAFANKTVTKNSNFEIFVDASAFSLEGEKTSITLSHGGKIIAQQKIQINNRDYAAQISFTTTAQSTGLQQYTITAAKTGAESNLQNNTKTVFVAVVEKKTKILLAAAAPHPDLSVLKRAIEEAPQFQLTLINNGKLPENLNEYDILIAYQISPPTITIPTWFISGLSSSPQLITNIKQLHGGAVHTGAREVLASLNPSFAHFTLPASIKNYIPKMPPLQLTLGGIKSSENTLFTFGAEAIWTLHPGTLPHALLTGEGLWRWGIYEYKNFNEHNTTNTLIQQTLSFLQVDKDMKPFTLSVLKQNIADNEQAIILAELRNANGELINEPEAKLIMSAQGKDLTYNFEKSNNSYRLQAGLLAPGTYKLKGKVTWKGKTYEDFTSLHVSEIPVEALRTHADYELMYQLAMKSNGAFFTQYNFESILDSINNDSGIKTILHNKAEQKSIVDYKWLFFFLIGVISVEWFLRKYWGMN